MVVIRRDTEGVVAMADSSEDSKRVTDVGSRDGGAEGS